jgi:addiction module RelE/StbE family toxin
MEIKNIYYSSHFKKSLRKYASYKGRIIKKIKKFLKNPFDSSLKTHKLSGSLSSYWSFSIDYNLRIIFEFINDKSVGLIDIGTHEIYKK